ncbi:MAG: EAL domain-containing protein [Treponema sp.]|nr:EAL domain-containing protein [Treponema sp.]
MSKAKDKKLRKLKHRSLIHRIISIIIVETIILFSFIALLAFSVINTINTYVLRSDEEIRPVLKLAQENWDNKTILEQQLNEYRSYTPNIADIIFIENNENVVIKIGDTTPDKKILSTRLNYGNQIYHRRISDIDADFRVDYKTFFRTINIFKLVNNKPVLEWSNTRHFISNQWIIYKTDIEGINLAVNYNYMVSNFHICFMFSILFILIIGVVFSNFFEIFNIASLISNQRTINRIVFTDPVTGGYNKTYFAEKALKRMKKKYKYAIVQTRLEKYRNYCTAYGLKQGENLLEEIYESTQKQLEKEELIAHFEKSDFILLLRFDDKDSLLTRLKSFAETINKNKKHQHLLFNAGACQVESKKDDINYLINASGLALSKTSLVKPSLLWFSNDMTDEQVWERRIEDDMESAIEYHQFKVYLQPKYSAKKQKLSAAEALVRWDHPEIGLVPPGKFIPLFEKNGFITHLDDYMLNEVARLQAKWLEQGKKLFPISVNVSRAHFSREDLCKHICDIINAYDVPHEFIELELTESAFFDDKASLLHTIKQLKDCGFKVSMDDFGAGYSSLNSLKELPLDIIKLDAEFFRGIEDINRANMIVSQTISLAKKLGMEIVAEGIETREQVDFLAKQNCDLIQGYYFAKPLTVEEFESKAWVKKTAGKRKTISNKK